MTENELVTRLRSSTRSVKSVLSNVFQQSVTVGTGDVTGPSSAVTDRIATFNGTTGKIIKDGGSKISDLVPTSRTINGIALSSNIVVPTMSSYVRSGNYLTNSTNAAAATTTAILQNSLRAFPFILSKQITFTEITSEVATLVSSTTYRLGIYSDDGNAYPSSLISGTDVGTYDSGSTGIKSSGTVNITLNPGLYWVAVNSNGAPSLRSVAVASMPALLGASAVGANTIYTRWTASLTYQAMPSSFPAGASLSPNAIAPMIGLLIS